MRISKLLLAGALGVGIMTATGQAGEPGHMGHAVLSDPGKIVWGPAPPGLPPGSKAAVLTGNPAAKGPFALRAWLPDGYRVPPHWHPVFEHLTVLSGTIYAGGGDTMDLATADKVSAGGFVEMPANMHHWVVVEGDTVLHIQGEGPFAITYVSPADDPRQMKAATK